MTLFDISYFEIEKDVHFKISLCKLVLTALKGNCGKCQRKLGADLSDLN